MEMLMFTGVSLIFDKKMLKFSAKKPKFTRFMLKFKIPNKINV